VRIRVSPLISTVVFSPKDVAGTFVMSLTSHLGPTTYDRQVVRLCRRQEEASGMPRRDMSKIAGLDGDQSGRGVSDLPQLWLFFASIRNSPYNVGP
jgi:hypothetical protein